ncbi:MFS transporter [Dietzia kunjamensis]|uniref:MFS transporter n=1 Tax=Dietzia kunjamensis TaxID=322509 RepID=UPI0013309360|nr:MULTISPECIES: MFS transporter [Dietzia]MBB0991001.1 MFS transporter [Dietzia sp. SLG510A3-30A2]MBB0996360.1 MFS transporter [Dietzia maris]MCZ4655148.1 MFS transporter [Dietzia kunjamensis]
MAEATIDPDDRGGAGATAATAVPHQSDKQNRGNVRSLAASTTGQLFEWYEWTAYAVFAPYIAAVMFNNENPVSALLATFAVFAVGFLMRPLGGIVFGRIADVRGRKFVLITTMLMMAGASLLIGLLPSYETLGIFASALLLLCRMIQGFAHGGESATAYSYVAEIAPPHRRGMWGSLVFVAIMGGTVIAYGIGGGITAMLSESAVGEWGWRVPFLLGAVFALFVLYLRSGMEESDVFDKAAAAAAADPTSPVATFSRRKLAGAIALVVAMVSGITVAHYTWSSYASTFAITQRGMDSEAAFWAIFGSQLIALCTLPLWGLLSDHIGRRPVIFIFAIGTIITTPMLMGMIDDRPWTLFLASLIAMTLVAAAGSILSSFMSEAFPTKMRTAGIGFAYSLSVAVFGGSAPYLNAQFIQWDLYWMISAYIIALCVATMVATAFMKETRGHDLHRVGHN